jgi:hypothetical protein
MHPRGRILKKIYFLFLIFFNFSRPHGEQRGEEEDPSAQTLGGVGCVRAVVLVSARTRVRPRGCTRASLRTHLVLFQVTSKRMLQCV